MWGISSWAAEVEKHLCQALKDDVCAYSTACISSSPKCPFYVLPALCPACQMGQRNLPTPSAPSSLILGEAAAELVEGGECLNGLMMEMRRRGGLWESRRAEDRSAEAQSRGWSTPALCDLQLALRGAACSGYLLWHHTSLSLLCFPFVTGGTPGCMKASSPLPVLSSGAEIPLPKPGRCVPIRSLLQLLGWEQGGRVSLEHVCPTEKGKRTGTFAGSVSAESR